MRKKIENGLFIALCLVLLLVPALLGDWSQGISDQSIGLQSQMIDLHSRLTQALMRDSGTQRVTLGRSGMLFLTDTVDDFTQSRPMTDAQIMQAADTLQALNTAVCKKGSCLIVLIAPNKNSVYPQYMPFYTLKGTGESDLERLQQELAKRQIIYIDALSVLKSAKERVYHLTDTHWNDAGALMVYRALITVIANGAPYEDYADIAFSDALWSGDLERMARPLSAQPEITRAVTIERRYRTRKPIRTLDDMAISTTCDAKGDALVLMSHDSFGKALFPMLANGTDELSYVRERDIDKLIELSQGTNCVVYEIAQRNLRLLIGEEITE